MEESNTVAGIACCGAQRHFDARKNINPVQVLGYHLCKRFHLSFRCAQKLPNVLRQGNENGIRN